MFASTSLQWHENFGQYISMWPGVFAFLGMKNPEKGSRSHHNQNFDIDEDVLFKGRAASATYAIEFLKQGPDTKGMARYNSFKDLLKFLERGKGEYRNFTASNILDNQKEGEGNLPLL